MKLIENKKVSISFGGVTREATYTEFMKDCVTYVNQKVGITYEEMKKRDRLFDKCKDFTVEQIELEDADHKHLVELVKTMPWTLVDKAILQFCTDVEEAQTIDKKS